MNFKNSIDTLKQKNRFRSRKIFDTKIIDMASNDYLGLAQNKKIFSTTYKHLKNQQNFGPKASMLVNGYSQIHKNFEYNLLQINHFESAIVVGSGFLANIALFESLVRKGDILFVDELYHASGILASQLIHDQVIFFKHNDAEDLRSHLQKAQAKNIFIAVEGIYSMDGDKVTREIIELSREFDTYLIVDEAHSSGILGKHLMGIFDEYDLEIRDKDIKMGTLGKAYGSYGAYILGSQIIVSFLENRAKPIIYSTAPSIFDIEYANNSLNHIITERKKIRQKIDKRVALAEKYFQKPDGLILKIEVGDNKKVIDIQNQLLEKNILIGAIRQPTVEKAILRVILRTNIKLKEIKRALKLIKELV